MAAWYLENDQAGSAYGWAAVTAWAALTAYSVGQIVRQNTTPTVNAERCFICTVAGTSLATEPTWNTNKGYATNESGGPTWRECTGQAAVNGDAANTPDWTASTNYSINGTLITKNTAGTHHFLVTTDSGSSGASEPSWDTTTGATTSDGGITWTCIGAVGDFNLWGAPIARVLTGGSFAVGRDVVRVSSRHNDSNTAGTNISTGNALSAAFQIICVDYADGATLATGAVTELTGTTSLTIYGFGYVYGITFKHGASSSNGIGNYGAGNNHLTLDNCTHYINSAALYIGYDSSTYGGHVTLKNCNFVFSAENQSIYFQQATPIKIDNLAISGTLLTTLFKGTNGAAAGASVRISNSDLSGVTGYLFDVGALSGANIDVINCKLHASVTVTTGAFHIRSDKIRLFNCTSENINYSYRLDNYCGVIQHETTTVRTGGASDGVTPISLQIVSSANSWFGWPLISDPIAQWNETTGSQLTATVEIAGSVELTNADIWLELEYLGDTTSCKGSTVSTRCGLMASAAVVTSSAASWGGSPTYTQKLQATFTPQKKGPVVARVCVGKASATVYVDPMLTLT